MSFLAWIVLGAIAGFITSKLVSGEGEGFGLDLALGAVGAVVGGFLFDQFGAAGVTGFDLYSLFVALVGSVAVLAAYHLLFARRLSA